MGAFLHIGFIAQATCTLPKGVSKAQFLKEVEPFYPKKAFDCIESGNSKITLSIKPEVARKEILPFVKQVYNDYHGETHNEEQTEVFKFIEQHVGLPDWLEKADEANFYDFTPYEDEFTEDFEFDGHDLRLQTNIIALGSEGKFLMEECEKTLQFMENCAQRAYSKFLLGNTFRVFIL